MQEKSPAPPENVPNPVARKLQRIFDSKIETDKQAVEVLQTLSGFYSKNTIQNRRNLRRDIEKRTLNLNREFLESFKTVKEKLDGLSTSINSMHSCCEEMTKRLHATKEKTRDLIEKTRSLQAESKEVDKKLDVSNAFLKKFVLESDELKALKVDLDGNIHHGFFAALEKTKQIHSDCKFLMRGAQQRTGLEIMERSATVLEESYENLYRWIQRECRLLSGDAMEISPLLSQAMQALQDRPLLLKYALDEFSTARRNAVVRGFIEALTRGGPGGVPKPIELLSHDPLRYVNDLLAWIHQSIASEHEHLLSLLKLLDEEAVTKYAMECLSHITEGLCRPLKVRVEQVLSGENGPVILYKLSNVFKFYIGTIRSSVGETGSIIVTMKEVQDLSSNLFYSSLSNSVTRLMSRIESPGDDLQPVQGLHQVLLLLRDVLESHDTTLVPDEGKQENYNKIFNTVLDPLIQALILSAATMPPVDSACYVLNSLNLIHSTLSVFEFIDERLEMLEAQMEAQCDVLVSEQAGYILDRAGLASLYAKVLYYSPDQGPLSQLTNADGVSVKSAMDRFDLFLGSPDSYRLPQYNSISSVTLKQKLNQRTCDALCSVYQRVYDEVYKSFNLYENPDQLIPKSVDQIKQLLTQK